MTQSQDDLDVIRHSASHVLAQAVQQVFPDAKLGIGPAISDGFYYDFELSRPLTDADLDDLQTRVDGILKEKQTFKQFDLPREKAEALMSEKGQDFKLELISDLDLEDYSFYENGPFVDLCRGPHIENTADIPVVKLLKVSGAYWKGSESNKMLQRIYGTAFFSQKELDDYLTQVEEAKLRDHRVIGKAMDLYSIQDEIGSGLVVWTPQGAFMRHVIENLWKEIHFQTGYQLLYSPHIGKSNLWKTSGHLDFYEENMYSPISIDDQDYYLRPMNCPFHIMVYKQTQHSYRELPIRYAELGTVYRYERSGVLHGLMRVRGFTQDDAHIICTKDQIIDEILDVLKLCLGILKVFEFEDYKLYVSTKPKEKSVGDDSDWEKAQESLVSAVESLGMEYDIDEGGGAFYGPKIDIKIKDAIGREWQCSTIQFDFNLPERFDMTYIDNNGKKERPFMVHRAIFGSLERFLGVLIEHYSGKFPLWMSSNQVKILCLSDQIVDYCKNIQTQMSQSGLKVQLDSSSEKLGYKIRRASEEKVPYMLIVGKRDKENGVVSVRKRGDGDMGQMDIESFIKLVSKDSQIPKVVI